MRRLACLPVVAVAIASAAPASADTGTVVAIHDAVASEATISVSGTLTLGADATAPALVADDLRGDDLNGPVTGDGLDLGKSFLSTTLSPRTLTFAIDVFDMSSVVDGVMPTFVYDWQFTVDGENVGFVHAGYAVGYGHIGTSKFFRFCDENFSCQPVTGTMAGGTTRVVVPMSIVGAAPGSVIGTGQTLSAPAISSTWSPWALFHNFGGDGSDADTYTVPGGVRLGIAPAGTPVDLVETPAPATVASDGSFTGTLEAPGKPGAYVVVARSCFGSDRSGRCVVASRPVSL